MIDLFNSVHFVNEFYQFHFAILKMEILLVVITMSL